MRKILSAIFLLLAVFVSAQIAQRPSPQKLYNNLSKEFPDFLSSDQAQILEEKLNNSATKLLIKFVLLLLMTLTELMRQITRQK
jgi:hypothetical protein